MVDLADRVRPTLYGNGKLLSQLITPAPNNELGERLQGRGRSFLYTGVKVEPGRVVLSGGFNVNFLRKQRAQLVRTKG